MTTRTRSNTIARLSTISAIGLLATSASPAFAQTRILYGTVRDFLATHPDFGLATGAGAPQVSGNVALLGDPTGDPIFVGGGGEVPTPWINMAGDEIAPHMAHKGPDAGLRLSNVPTTKNMPLLDTYDPALGGYGGDNIGPIPNMQTGISMPPDPAIPNVGLSIGDVLFRNLGTTVVNSSFRCGKFEMRNQHTIQIDGNLAIVVDTLFSMRNNCNIELLPGSSLDIYCLGTSLIENSNLVGFTTNDHTLINYYHLSTDPFRMENNTHMYGTLFAPRAEMQLTNTADFYGLVTAQNLNIEEPSGLHIASTGGTICYSVSDTDGAWGMASDGMITDASSFKTWFKTIPGLNADAAYGITLVDAGGGAIQFETPDFTPVDGKLFGNEGEPNNRNFTYELVAQFNYAGCAGTFFEVEGDGDVWVFIDNKLVIDMAGAQQGGRQVIDIDRLGLIDTKPYLLRFYYAQRRPGMAPLRVRTNIDLNPGPGLVTSMAMHD